MSTQSINLLYTNTLKFNNQSVTTLKLNGNKIWGGPTIHSFTGSGNTLSISSTSWTTGTLTVSLGNTPLRTDSFFEVILKVSGNEVPWTSINQTQTVAYYTVQLLALSLEGSTATITVRYRKTGSSYPTGYIQFNNIEYIYPYVQE